MTMMTYVEDLGEIVGHAGAVEGDKAELFDLGQGPPVHVGRAYVDVRPVDQPELRVENPAAEEGSEVQASHLVAT